MTEMEPKSCIQFEETYSHLMKGDFNQSVTLFAKLMSDNSLEILDLAEAETDASIGPSLSQSSVSLCSGGSGGSALSSGSDSSGSLSERGHVRTRRLKRRFRKAVKSREAPLSAELYRHLKRALLLATCKLQAFPDQSEGYLEAAAVMSLLSQWDAAEQIYEIGLARCEDSANRIAIERHLGQLRAINRHICDTLTRTT